MTPFLPSSLPSFLPSFPHSLLPYSFILFVSSFLFFLRWIWVTSSALRKDPLFQLERARGGRHGVPALHFSGGFPNSFPSSFPARMFPPFHCLGNAHVERRPDRQGGFLLASELVGRVFSQRVRPRPRGGNIMPSIAVVDTVRVAHPKDTTFRFRLLGRGRPQAATRPGPHIASEVFNFGD